MDAFPLSETQEQTLFVSHLFGSDYLIVIISNEDICLFLKNSTFQPETKCGYTILYFLIKLTFCEVTL